MKFNTKIQGKKYSETFKVYITQNECIVSPFHDIKLYKNKKECIIRVVNEIPRMENAKFEISKNDYLNPIKQDIKKGKPRFVQNVYPFKGYLWNYGALPQTWEDPEEFDKFVSAKGDNDPLDVIDIGTKRKDIGEVYEAKVLGCLALLDEEECDWKILVIDVKDKLASEINDITDIEKHFGSLKEDTLKWFEQYKIPDGKPKNVIGLDRKYMDKKFAMDVIDLAHNNWKKLIENKTYEGISLLRGSNDPEFPIKVENLDDNNVPDYVNEYFFLNE